MTENKKNVHPLPTAKWAEHGLAYRLVTSPAPCGLKQGAVLLGSMGLAGAGSYILTDVAVGGAVTAAAATGLVVNLGTGLVNDPEAWAEAAAPVEKAVAKALNWLLG